MGRFVFEIYVPMLVDKRLVVAVLVFWRLLAGLPEIYMGQQMIRKNDAVEMVNFMLDDLGQ